MDWTFQHFNRVRRMCSTSTSTPTGVITLAPIASTNPLQVELDVINVVDRRGIVIVDVVNEVAVFLGHRNGLAANAADAHMTNTLL